MKTPKFHPNSICAVLKKGGLQRSEWHRSGQIRGWGHSTCGFQIHTEYGEKKQWKHNRAYPGSGYMATVCDKSVIKEIKIDWRLGDYSRRNSEDAGKIIAQYLEKMESILVQTGYCVERNETFIKILAQESQ